MVKSFTPNDIAENCLSFEKGISSEDNIFPINHPSHSSQQEADLRAFLENAPIGIHWVDENGIITWANRAELEMLGYARDEYIGHPVAKFHVDHDVIANILNRRMTNGETLSNFEVRLRHKDGSIRHGAINSTILSKNGKFIHARCFTRDITETKNLEEKIHDQFKELENIYRTAPIGLALIDREFRFSRINERLAEINGVSVEKHFGRTPREIVPDLASQIEEIFQKVLKTGEPVLDIDLEGETNAQPGVRRVWSENWYPLKDASGATVAVNVVVEEITERKRVQTTLLENARIKDALYQLADNLHRATSLNDIYRAALEAIITALRCDRASILLFDKSGVMRFVGWLGLSESYRCAVEGHSPWKSDEKKPGPICINDIDLADIADSLKATVKNEGIGSLAFIPLVSNSKLIGKFMIYFNAPHDFCNEELDASQAIARQLALGIEHKRAEEALRDSEHRFRQMIDALPAAIYTTDAAGCLTHFNPAAVEFSGQVPELGTDHWCVSWKLYNADGTPLPHDECPMAISLKEGRIIRDVQAIAERPDGTRRWFIPHPTPLRDVNGNVVGGINMLVDITTHKEAERALAQFAAIVTSSSDAILSKTLEGIITSWNPSAEHMFGYTAEEMIGQSILRLIPPERRSEEDEILVRLKAGQRIEHYETIRMKKNGERMEVSLTISPMKNNDGKITGASKIIRDITESKRTERLLRDQTRQLALITDTAPVFIAYCDPAGRYKFVNKSYAQRFGLRPEDCVGKTIPEIVGEQAYEVFRKYADVVMRGEFVEFDVAVPHSSIGRRFMHCSYAPEIDSNGTVVGYIAAIIDITERNRIEEALRTSEERLKEADRRKDEFLAMLAHELRNPLAPIANAVHLLRQNRTEDPTQQQARAIIERQTGRLSRLVDDLLEVSRITTGRIRLYMERVTISGIVERATETVRPLVEQHSHTLTVTLPPEPIWVYADTARLEQSLVNLLNNAVKYTDDGGRIEIVVKTEGAQVILSVRDTGIGIDPDLLPYIFDLFTQAERSLDRSHGGLGIGLSLVQRLVSMHGGTVIANSTLGKGSEFIVCLPMAQSPTSEARNTTVKTNGVVRSLRILVVDDNADAAHSLAMLLEVSGHVVWTAHDGLAAIEAAHKHKPHVIFLDIGLPKVDGYSVAQKLRANEQYNEITLVAMTGYGQTSDHERSYSAGFNRHLVKPVDFSHVEQVLAEVSKKALH